jgi:ketosteroid isomerase-like protein
MLQWRPRQRQEPARMRELIDRYIAAYNRMDVDAMLATVHREVVFENTTAGRPSVRTSGIEELRRLAENSRHLFSARRQTITGYHEEAGVAYVQIHFEGSFAVDLPNGVRAGQAIAMSGRSEFRVLDGLLVHIADYSD